jgi:hypothetical protein
VADVATQVYRVAVSGPFDELSESTRARLVRNASEHDPVLAEFGPEPNLSYRRSLDVLTVRIEIRVDDDDPEPSATAEALAVAETREFLRVLGIAHRRLRARVTAMSNPA